LPWYDGSSPWGGPIAPPSLVVEVLFFQDQTHTVNAHVVAVSESSKTESLWFDSTAHDSDRRLIATQRMMLRFMKDSSPLYQ